MPLGETSEAYDLEISDTGGTLLRTTSGLAAPGFTYSAAMIVDDLAGAAELLTLRVFQIGILGRGAAAEISVQI